MKRLAVVVGILLIGFAAGVLVDGLLERPGRAVYREVLRLEFRNEEEALAKQAERDGDNLQAVVHRANVVAASSPNGIQAFVDRFAIPIEKDWSFGLGAVVLRKIEQELDPEGVGARLGEGLARGKLARALERAGERDRAREQWALAGQLWDAPPDRVRQAIEHLGSEGG